MRGERSYTGLKWRCYAKSQSYLWLVAINDDVFWIRQDWKDFSEQMPKALKVASKKGKGIGQYTLIVIPTLIEIVDEVWLAAQKSKVVDMESFRRRAKAQPTKVA